MTEKNSLMTPLTEKVLRSHEEDGKQETGQGHPETQGKCPGPNVSESHYAECFHAKSCYDKYCHGE